MKKMICFIAGSAALTVAQVHASDFEEKLLANNRLLEDMSLTDEKLKLQASMAESFKKMAEAGFIVDELGNPRGVGDMELLAIEVRRRSQQQATNTGFDSNDPFGGLDPIIPAPSSLMPGVSPFGPMPETGPAQPEPAQPAAQQVIEVTKPTEEEKRRGRQILSLVEIRNNTAVLFTNDGYQELKIGDKVYDYTLRSVGNDEVSLRNKDGNRILRIDWTRSVRYTDD